MRVKLHVWRQDGPKTAGRMETYELDGVTPDLSFLEMMDMLNEQLITDGKEPVAFEHDCREGICGTCNMVINGEAHGPEPGTTVCQLHMRTFQDGAEIFIEPWRAAAFPVMKDLVVDRSSFDRIVQAGGFISVNTGNAPDAHAVQVPKDEAETSMDAAACIGCGACVAACPNGAAMLFTAAKLAHLNHLPQGQAERPKRVKDMVGQMDAEGFGNCTNHYECGAACPKEISVEFIAEMNKDYFKALLATEE